MKRLLFLFLLLTPLAHATPHIDLDIIIEIESNWNEKADSYKTPRYGRGLAQISEIALQMYP